LCLESLKKELERRKIFLSVRGKSLRVSPNIYNDQEDIDALVEALAVAIKGR